MNRSGEALNPSLPPAWSGAGRDRGVQFMINRINKCTMHMRLQRAYPLFLALLLILAAASWGRLIGQSRMMKRLGMCQLHQQEGS
jgi:hypothetical protein